MAQTLTLRTYTRAEAAKVLGLEPQTLARWAVRGRGPRYSRTGPAGGRVLYTEPDLMEWLEKRKVDPATKGS